MADSQNAADRVRMEEARCWQAASDRLLLYLRCLNLPPEKALALSMEALEAAQIAVSTAEGKEPVPGSMQALGALLNGSEPEAPARHRALEVGCECVVAPAPAIHRRPMVPETMATAPWHFLRVFRPKPRLVTRKSG